MYTSRRVAEAGL
ncbi:hypothetical protein PMALA_045520, partial [Plasmodium malariae]